MSDEAVAQLVAMGFDPGQGKLALGQSNGNLEQAVNLLLSGSPLDGGGSSGGGSGGGGGGSTTMVVGTISQYSIDQGRSACTCIALTAASKTLQNANITPDLLQSMITEGVQHYQSISSSSTSSVEHMSAEEVLQQDPNGERFKISCLGGPRQGVLNRDPNHEVGLRTSLQNIRRDQPPAEWMAVLLTKTPETVLLLLPPPKPSEAATQAGSDSNSPPLLFWLIDSHPRSAQLGTDTAYGKPHSSLGELCTSVETIFPLTDLGPDVPDMMAMMYNSFDLYPLVKKK